MFRPVDIHGPSASPPARPDREWLIQKGRLGAAIAAYPWEQTSLGGLDQWPPHLRSSVSLMLGAAMPMALIWGKESLFLYNDLYAEIIQDKHPSALGARGPDIFPESWPSLRPLFERALQGEAILSEDLELMLTRRGVTKPSHFLFSYNPVENEQGKVDGFLAVAVETTSRVAREQQRAHVFDTVLSAITDFAYTFDQQGRFLYVNKALLDLWGLPLADAVGKNFFDLKYPEDLAERLQRQIREVITRKTVVRDETRYVSPTGVEGYYEYIFSPVFESDGTVSIVAGSTRDITSRKELEMAAFKASQAKDDFIATLSHELRTPLNPVLLLATESAANPELPEKVRADFQSIAEHVSLEARLIDDLLDISRITHDKLPLTLRPLDLHRLLFKSVNSIESELKKKNQTLIQRLNAPCVVVNGDEGRLLQVFGNLLRNAVKFTPAAGRITLQTEADSTRPNRVVVEISDNGLGMTPEELTLVFEPFTQGDHTRDEVGRFGGLGLGLAISRKITELHLGTIGARSAGRDQGATFVVALPTDPSAVLPDVRSSDSPSATRRDNSGIRILLVEDHESSRQALARLLASRHIVTVQAASAAEALEIAKVEPFDLVISDIGLPDVDGYTLMATLKKTYGLRGIALSGYGMEDDIARSKEVGFLTHITKPVRVQVLEDVLARFVRRPDATPVNTTPVPPQV